MHGTEKQVHGTEKQKQEQESPGRKRGRHSRPHRQGDAAVNEVSVDKSQLIGEVRERNKLYRALTEIQEIAKAASERQGSVPELDAIGNICRKTLKAINQHPLPG